MYNDILSIGKTIIECQSLDVVIFSLSLMGKNWQEYIVEAKRCLSTRCPCLKSNHRIVKKLFFIIIKL
ncbi:MAG: hypothetical protein ACXWFC_14665 [Nitrososphaeraceae archaeon]